MQMKLGRFYNGACPLLILPGFCYGLSTRLDLGFTVDNTGKSPVATPLLETISNFAGVPILEIIVSARW
ncbi:hypothetical protein C8R45DRAFT_1035064 [Mycena sanguinolenta]|nr:hypothetical protein C8R45DRAFT_1035064 [Mycena sanguinolenta]